MSNSPATTQNNPRLSIWSVGFVMLLITNLFQSAGQMMMNTVIPLYADAMGAGATVVGVAAGAFGVTALASRPFAGPAFDSFSKKWMLFGAVALITIATFLYSVASSVPVLIGVRLLHGLAMGFSGPLGLSLATETLPPSRISSGVGVYSLAQAIGLAAGPAIGICLSQAVGYPLAFRFASGAMCIALVLLFFFKEPPGQPRKPYQLKLNRMFAREAIMPAVLLLLLMSAFCCTNSFLAIYAGLLGVEGIGLYFTVYALCLVVTRPIFGRLADTFGSTKVLIPAMLCFAASYTIISLANSLPVFIVAAIVASCGFGACLPLLQAVTMKLVSPDAHGAASNTTYTGMDLANLVGPAAGGMIIEALHAMTGDITLAYTDMWLVMLIPIAASLVIFIAWLLAHRDKARVI